MALAVAVGVGDACADDMVWLMNRIAAIMVVLTATCPDLDIDGKFSDRVIRLIPPVTFG